MLIQNINFSQKKVYYHLAVCHNNKRKKLTVFCSCEVRVLFTGPLLFKGAEAFQPLSLLDYSGVSFEVLSVVCSQFPATNCVVGITLSLARG